MKKIVRLLGTLGIAMLLLSACGDENDPTMNGSESSSSKIEAKNSNSSEEKKEASKKESSSSTMTQAKAESIALNYFKSFNFDTNNWTPKVKSSRTIDTANSFNVAVYDNENHFVAVTVNKSTGKASSLSLEY
ncbi:hypothetical protein [Dellaglioa carnosa]|uniref:hypothetical protein n=1 Tax=Dellaglioa carnosa TaxID=2995136 RepID=UPI0022A8991D|nr:hypothetical protein [Dellaglioa carnosa]MCZ2492475.1 hypothetical protein [Dellaglioa carnosa]